MTKSEIMTKLRSDPEFVAKNIAATKAHNDTVRGFSIPAEKAAEYRILMKKGIRSKEAGRMLGLVD